MTDGTPEMAPENTSRSHVSFDSDHFQAGSLAPKKLSVGKSEDSFSGLREVIALPNGLELPFTSSSSLMNLKNFVPCFLLGTV